MFRNRSEGDIESMRIVDSFVLLRKQRQYLVQPYLQYLALCFIYRKCSLDVC